MQSESASARGAAQDYAKECRDKAAMRADLARRVRGLPLHMEAVVAHTPDSHLYLNVIGDRCAQSCRPLEISTQEARVSL